MQLCPEQKEISSIKWGWLAPDGISYGGKEYNGGLCHIKLAEKIALNYESKAGMPIPYRGGMKALFILLVCNVSFYCFFRDMSDTLAIIRTRPQCREAAP